MGKLSRSLARTLGIAFALLIAAWTGVWLKLNDAVLGAFISRQVNKSERGQFLLGRAHYPYVGGLVSILLNTRVRVTGDDFRLLDPDGNQVLDVPHVDADIHLQELIASLGQLALSGGTFHLTLHFAHAEVPTGWAIIAPTRSSWRHPHAETNIVAAMSSRKKTESATGSELRIVVDDIELGDIGFAMASAAPSGRMAWWSRVDHAKARARLVYSSARINAAPEGPFFFFEVGPLDAARADLQLGDYHFPLEALHVDHFGSRPPTRQDLLFHATARALGAGVTVDGALTDAFREPGIRLRLDFVHGKKTLALAPPPLSTWLGGDPHGFVTINGPFARTVIAGGVEDVDADIAGIKLTSGSVKLKLQNGVLTLDPVGGKVARGSASAAVEVELGAPGRWSAKLHLRGIDPAALPQLPRPLGRALAGRMEARLRLTGNLIHHPERIAIGNIQAELERAHGDGLPRKIALGGAIDFTPTLLTLRGLKASGDGLNVGADGTLDPRAGALSAAVRVDGTPPPGLVARLGGPSDLGVGTVHLEGRVSGPVTRPQLQLHALATGVSYARRSLDRLEAELTLKGGTLQVNDLRAHGLGAAIDGVAELSLFEHGDLTRPLQVPTVHANLHARGAELAVLAGIPGVLDGRADLDLELDGPLAHPSGHAALTLPKLGLQGDAYVNGELRVVFDDDGATVQALKLTRQKGGEVSGAGRVRWNGDLELSLKPQSFPLAAIPGIQSLPVALSGMLSGEVTLGGDVTHPLPGGRIELNGFRVRGVPLGRGQLHMEPGSDAIHIQGSFFGIVTVDGYITMTPKLGVTATIGFKDLALERLLPELQQLAEVKALATGEMRFSFDSEAGLTFAALTLRDLKLTLTSDDESGHAQKLLVKNEDDVLLTTDGRVLEVKRANLVSTIGEFKMSGIIGGQKNDVRMEGRIGLELLEYFFRGLFEHTHGPANLALTIRGDLAHPEVNGWLEVGGQKGPAVLVPQGLEQRLTLIVPSGRVEVTSQSVKLRRVSVTMDGKVAVASGEVALKDWKPGALSGSITGEISPKLIQWRWLDQLADAAGSLGVDLHLGGTWERPEWRGRADIKDVVLRARRLERDLRITRGSVIFDNYDVAIGCPPDRARPDGCQSLSGIIDETSAVSVDGLISFGEGLALRRLDIRLQGSDIRYATPDYAVSFSPRGLRLYGDGNQLTLRGKIDLVEGRFSRNYDVASMVLRPRAVEVQEPFWQGIPLLETMQLQVRAQSAGPLLVKNNVAELTLDAALDISGTLSEPRLDGSIVVQPGGRITVPAFRLPFVTQNGTVRFDEEKKIPEQTPTIDLTANAEYTDNRDVTHILIMRLFGTPQSLGLDFASQDGWDRAQVAMVVMAGAPAEEIRRATQGASPGSGGADGITKTVTGAAFGQILGGPLTQVTGFDTFGIEFGAGSVDLKLCKRIGRYVKTCGQGEVGFSGSSRFGTSLELRLSDTLSGVGRVEYLTRGVDTLQDSLTSGKAELRLRLPLGY